jgi:alpha-L-rhamnosidase-like protein
VNVIRSGNSGVDRTALDHGWEGERFPVFPLLPDSPCTRSSPAFGSTRCRERRDDPRHDRSGVNSNTSHESRALRHLPGATDEEETITFCKASLDAPQGLLSIAWRVDGESFSAVVDLPFGTTGLLDPPSGPSSLVVVDGRQLEDNTSHSAVLAPGRHTLEVTRPVLVSKAAP